MDKQTYDLLLDILYVLQLIQLKINDPDIHSEIKQIQEKLKKVVVK